jgi:hypothetical protein
MTHASFPGLRAVETVCRCVLSIFYNDVSALQAPLGHWHLPMSQEDV